MAIICRDHGLLFVLNPRTGSSAIAHALREELGGEWLPEQSILNERGRQIVSRKHSTVRQILKYGLMTEQELKDYFVFTTIRNPYASLYSKYAKKINHHARMVRKPGSRISGKWWRVPEIEYCQDHSFNEWIMKYYGRPLLRLPKPKVRSMYRRYAADADAVIRFEHLQSDFERILREAGVEKPVSIPMKNPTEGKKGSYRDHYSRLSRMIVYLSYRADIKRFDYRF